MDRIAYDVLGMGYVINLDTAVERRRETARYLSDHNIPFLCIDAVHGEDVDVVEGFDGTYPELDNLITKREYACTLSHIKAIKEGIRSGADKFCIFEDDIVIGDDFEIKLIDGFQDVPYDWMIVSLGCNALQDIEPITNKVGRLKNLWGAWAYALTRRGAWEFYKHLVTAKTTVDAAMSSFNHKHGLTYGFYEQYVAHRDGYSFIKDDYYSSEKEV